MQTEMHNVTAGVYLTEISEKSYHADPCPAPSLSASTIKKLLVAPAHAYAAHPRLNPNYEEKHEEKFDLGKAAHSLMLRDKKDFAIFDGADWRTKESKEFKEKAYKENKIPMLSDQWVRTQEMHERARSQIAASAFDDAFNENGASEVTVIWQEGDVWCRIRLDWWDKKKRFYDYKTTADSANPETLSRLFSNLDYEITDAFYRRGIAAILGVDSPEYRFVVQENYDPYLLSCVSFDPMAREQADRKVEYAIKLWGTCLKNNLWPGYPVQMAQIGITSYKQMAWEERIQRENENESN